MHKQRILLTVVLLSLSLVVVGIVAWIFITPPPVQPASSVIPTPLPPTPVRQELYIGEDGWTHLSPCTLPFESGLAFTGLGACAFKVSEDGVLIQGPTGEELRIAGNNSFTETPLSVTNIEVCPCTLYVIKRGDTLLTLSRTLNVSLQALLQANPQINDPHRIREGEALLIPSNEGGFTETTVG